MEIRTKIQLISDTYSNLRIKGLVKNQSDMAALLGINRSSLSSALNGDEKYLTDKLLSKVVALANDYGINIQHYTTTGNNISISHSPQAIAVSGSGNSIGTDTSKIASQASLSSVRQSIPTIPIKAYRAVDFDVMKYFATTEDDIHLAPIIQQFPSSDCYYFVNTDDMAPNLRTNDLLCLARLPEGARVTNGDLCILNTKYQGILERFVYDEGDALLLKSTQPRWTDMRIPKEEIFSIFRILGGIRTNI